MKPEESYIQADKAFEAYLSENGFLYTQERRKVLQCITANCQAAFTPMQVVEWVKPHFISKATVYNTLQLLVRAHVVNCLALQRHNREVQYELATETPNYIQVICTRCGRVTFLRDVTIRNVITAKKYSNFRMQHFSLYLYGECKFCRRKAL